jgi:hypothetical protein
VCIISIVRLHALLVITTSTDQTYDNAGVATFSMVELNVALISACLPTLRPLLAQWMNGLSNSTGAGSSGGLGNSHNRKRSSVLPFGSHSLPMNSLASRKGVERLDGETEDDKIRVITRVDVRVSDKEKEKERGVQDERESSTESLFRNARTGGHVI